MKRQRSLFDFFPKKSEGDSAPVMGAPERGMTEEPLSPLVASSLLTPTTAVGAAKATLSQDGMPVSDSSAGVSSHATTPTMDAQTGTVGGQTGSSDSLSHAVEKAQRRRMDARRPKATVQMSLDFGQSNVDGTTTCNLCGMLFNATIEEDIRIHDRCCTALSSSTSCGGVINSNNNNNNNSNKSNKNHYNHNNRIGRCRVDDLSSWIASEQFVKALEGIGQPKRRGKAMGASTRSAAAKGFCERVQESPEDAFVHYVFDCSKQEFAVDAVACRLVEALGFPDVVLGAAAYCLIAVVHRHAARLLCAVAGRPSTREQDPTLVLKQTEGAAVVTTRCYTRSCVTFCDVPYVWCQSDAALAATAADWRPTKTVESVLSARVAVEDFFDTAKRRENKQERLRALVDAALRGAMTTLGRHVSYGHTLCPRLQFSYDTCVLSNDMLARVDAVTTDSGSAPLFTHTGNWDGFGDCESELSVISYGD